MNKKYFGKSINLQENYGHQNMVQLEIKKKDKKNNFFKLINK